jgi:hypothetical protein
MVLYRADVSGPGGAIGLAPEAIAQYNQSA